jgi:hypothetical protein
MLWGRKKEGKGDTDRHPQHKIVASISILDFTDPKHAFLTLTKHLNMQD